MADTILALCPFCGKSHKVSLTTFDSVASSSSSAAAVSPQSGFFPALFASDLGLALGLGSAAWVVSSVYGYSPLWAVGVGFSAGFGFPLLRLLLSRPFVLSRPPKVRVDVVIDDRREGGFTRFVDSFNPDLVGYDDLIKLSRAAGFSRSLAHEAGLSQDKWHKLKREFLRLNYCVSLPNGQNGYALTLRGRRLLDQIRARETNNNKQQASKNYE